MESEHVKASNENVQNKASNENVQNTPEAKPGGEAPSTEQAKNQQLSSPSSSEVDSDEDNPSTKPESNEEPVSLQDVIPASETATQISQPPNQMMGQPTGYDPNRIPASVFSTKNGNPGDWSTNSNESLFSIHMGNNSFSRDYAILFGKSGELQDWNNGSQFMISGELPRLESQLPNAHLVTPGKSSEFGNLAPVLEDPLHDEESSEFSKVQDTTSPKKENRVSSEGLNVVVPKKPPLPETNSSNLTSLPSPNRFSDASVHSGSSFAFPVLGSNDSGKNESVKVGPEKLEKGDEQPHSSNQAQVSKETPPASAGAKWFSCFSCWPRFC